MMIGSDDFLDAVPVDMPVDVIAKNHTEIFFPKSSFRVRYFNGLALLNVADDLGEIEPSDRR
ncbi:hypothetical protein GCM10027157_07980 [Corynebacterium aquatimens]